MPQFLYQAAYTSDSLAAQIKNPEDRLATVGGALEKTLGVKIVAGGFSFGDYDIAVILEGPDNETVAAAVVAIAAGGAIRASKTTPLLSGAQWVSTLKKASSASYKPAK